MFEIRAVVVATFLLAPVALERENGSSLETRRHAEFLVIYERRERYVEDTTGELGNGSVPGEGDIELVPACRATKTRPIRPVILPKS